MIKIYIKNAVYSHVSVRKIVKYATKIYKTFDKVQDILEFVDYFYPGAWLCFVALFCHWWVLLLPFAAILVAVHFAAVWRKEERSRLNPPER